MRVLIHLPLELENKMRHYLKLFGHYFVIPKLSTVILIAAFAILALFLGMAEHQSDLAQVYVNTKEKSAQETPKNKVDKMMREMRIKEAFRKHDNL